MLCCHALDLKMKHMTSIWWKQRIKRLKRTVSNALPLFSSIGRFVHPSRSFRSRKHVNGSMHYLINTCCKIIQVQTPPSCTLKMSWCPRCWSFSAESFLARKKTHTFTDTNACMLWLTPDDYKDSSALASGQYVTLLESHGMFQEPCNWIWVTPDFIGFLFFWLLFSPIIHLPVRFLGYISSWVGNGISPPFKSSFKYLLNITFNTRDDCGN